MTRKYTLRKSKLKDVRAIEALLLEWLSFAPKRGRTESIKSAIRRKEIVVAESGSTMVGFIHYVIHNDIIDGAPNSFITAFYVSSVYQGIGVGSALLESAIADSASRGVVSIETSTVEGRAKDFYLKHGFRQYLGEEIFLELDLQKTLSDEPH
jgi:GNAT superfamily N-acetyltransferase